MVGGTAGIGVEAVEERLEGLVLALALAFGRLGTTGTGTGVEMARDGLSFQSI